MKKVLVVFFVSFCVLTLGCALAEDQKPSPQQQSEQRKPEEQKDPSKVENFPVPQALQITIGPQVSKEQPLQSSK